MSRDPAAVQAEMLAISPGGKSLPKTPASNWGRMLLPAATEIARWENEAEALHAEIDPRTCFWLLPEWETLFGADPYGVDTTGFSTGQMQAYLYQRLTSKGGQSPGFFIGLAAAMGITINITEYTQLVYGVARYGDRYLVSPNQFMWLVTLPKTTARNAVYGAARYGDRYGTITPSPIVPIIQALAPAHTLPVFSYTG